MIKISKILLGVIVAMTMTGCAALTTRTPRVPSGDKPAVVDQTPHKVSTVSPTRHTASPYNGDWLIVEAGGQKVSTDDEMPYIIFSGDDGRFYASNGCNIINGVYGVDGNTITFGNVITTRAGCNETGYTAVIASVLSDGVSVQASLSNNGSETDLVLSQNGKGILKLRKHNLERLNGQWQVETIGQVKIEDDNVNVFFDSGEMTIHGNTGCNYFNGKIEVDPNTTNALSFSHMAVTMRACPNSDIERLMLVALEETCGYKLQHSDQLTLYSGSGAVLMTLHRTLKAE